MITKQVTTPDSSPDVDGVLDGYRELVQILSGKRTPEIPDSSVTMAQMRVLMVLVTLGEARMSELASTLNVSLSTASGLVERLVEAQLVVRHTDPADRRQVIASLTPAGIAFLDHFQELGLRHLRDLLAHLPPTDIATVRRALEVLIKAAAELPMEVNS